MKGNGMGRYMATAGLVLMFGCISSSGPWRGVDPSGTWHVVALSENENPGWATTMTIVEDKNQIMGSNSTGGNVTGQRNRDEVFLKIKHYKDGTIYSLQGVMDRKMNGKLLRGNWQAEGGDSGSWTASKSFGWK